MSRPVELSMNVFTPPVRLTRPPSRRSKFLRLTTLSTLLPIPLTLLGGRVAWRSVRKGARPSPPWTIPMIPDFSSVFFKLDIWGALKWSLAPAIVTVLMTDLFDSLSTFIGVAQAGNLLDERGEPRNLRQGLLVDAVATLGAGLFGSSSGTAFVESIAGIRMGGRTGLTAVVTAGCFLPCLFIGPIAAAIPPYATASVLILVGVSMFQAVGGISFDRLEIAVPGFATLILIPLTFSITQGILWGFILHAALHALVGRGRDVTAPAWVLAAVSIALLVIEHVH